jgi:hypothetical protein
VLVNKRRKPDLELMEGSLLDCLNRIHDLDPSLQQLASEAEQRLSGIGKG